MSEHTRKTLFLTFRTRRTLRSRYGPGFQLSFLLSSVSSSPVIESPLPDITTTTTTSTKSPEISPYLSPQRQGNLYEHQTIHFLHQYGIRSHHTGQTGDRGIDFRGTWHLSPMCTLPIIGQCKRTKKPVGPSTIRELAHVIRKEGNVRVLGIMCSEAGFTEGAREEWRMGNVGMVLVRWGERMGCTEWMWNVVAAEVLKGLMAGWSWEIGRDYNDGVEQQKNGGGAGDDKNNRRRNQRLELWYLGERVPPIPIEEDERIR